MIAFLRPLRGEKIMLRPRQALTLAGGPTAFKAR